MNASRPLHLRFGQLTLNGSTNASLARAQNNKKVACVVGNRRRTTLSNIQTRQASTSRRHRRWIAKTVPPAPSFNAPTSAILEATGERMQIRVRPHRAFLDASNAVPAGDRILFNPPPSMPSVYHTPSKFLPTVDSRKRLHTAKDSKDFPKPSPSLRQISTAVSISESSRSPTSVNPDRTVNNSLASASLPPALKSAHTKSYHLTREQIEEMQSLRQSDEKYWTRNKLAAKFNCSSIFVGMCVQASDQRLQKTSERLARQLTKQKTQDRVRRRLLWSMDA